MELSIMTLLLPVFAGLMSVMSPCVLPVVPIIVTGTQDDHKSRPLLVVAGLSITFILMGIITSAFGSIIGASMIYTG